MRAGGQGGQGEPGDQLLGEQLLGEQFQGEQVKQCEQLQGISNAILG
jgi:hypothetical protein